ncbi:hypothetical protein JKP88DRAFT_351199 [Tribonema minus]|uniref:Uncharacterized protein n=1 Tax=Tribonema minus TaxID=303371 RepID=A0A835YLQ8_9STRA|nr:hypothetical protein JKP88DRAFT_351199 [Tribonema minus]
MDTLNGIVTAQDVVRDDKPCTVYEGSGGRGHTTGFRSTKQGFGRHNRGRQDVMGDNCYYPPPPPVVIPTASPTTAPTSMPTRAPTMAPTAAPTPIGGVVYFPMDYEVGRTEEDVARNDKRCEVYEGSGAGGGRTKGFKTTKRGFGTHNRGRDDVLGAYDVSPTVCGGTVDPTLTFYPMDVLNGITADDVGRGDKNNSVYEGSGGLGGTQGFPILLDL